MSMEEKYKHKEYSMGVTLTPPTEIDGLREELNTANRKIEKLEKIVGALAVTNFLTQHEDGDEEVRDQSVEAVNRFSQRFKEGWKNERKIAELEAKKYELDKEIDSLKWGVKLGSGNYVTQIGQSIAMARNTVASNLLNTAFENGATNVVLPQGLMPTVGYGESTEGK